MARSPRDPERLTRRQARSLAWLEAGAVQENLHGTTLNSLQQRGYVWLSPEGPKVTAEGRIVLARYILKLTVDTAPDLATALADDMAALTFELRQMRRAL